MKPSFMIYFDQQWQVARAMGPDVEVRGAVAPECDVTLVQQALADLGYLGGGVCLAVPSRMVVAARVNGAEVPRNRRRAGMLCLLEEQIPLDVEMMTADFLPATGNWSLGVAVETAKVKALIDPLEAAGIEIAAVCPLALLALWDFCSDGEAKDATYALVRCEDTVDIFRLKSARPVSWYTVPDDEREITECIMADQLCDPAGGEPITAWVIAEPQWPVEAIKEKAGLAAVNRRPQPALASATSAAGEALGGRQGGWVNLRRDALAMTNPWTPMRRLAIAAAVLGILAPLVLAAAMLWRGLEYRDAADTAYQREAAAYRRANPNHAVPPMLNARLRSDLARLTGVSGGAGEVPRRPSALETLRRVVASLDPAMRLRILEMRVGPADVFLDCQARNFADAETVTRNLAAAGFEMDAPQVQSLPNDAGVSFTLSGRPGLAKAETIPLPPAGAVPATMPTSTSVPATMPTSTSAPTTRPTSASAPATMPTSASAPAGEKNSGRAP